MQTVTSAPTNDNPRMSRDAAYQRRKRMAEAVRGGKSLAAVAQSERVTIVTVRSACHEFEVPLPPARAVSA